MSKLGRTKSGARYLPDQLVGAKSGTGFHTTESRKFNLPGKKQGLLSRLLLKGFVPQTDKARLIQRAVLLRAAKDSNAQVKGKNREKFGRRLSSTMHPHGGTGRKMPPD